jgi:dUTP pyrophosphatase
MACSPFFYLKDKIMNQIDVKIFISGVNPEYSSNDAAGLDIKANAEVEINPGETKLIPTGVRLSIPSGYYGQLCSRSGLGAKKGLVVAQGVGIIDSDYRGEVFVPIRNQGDKTHHFCINDKIAQLIFIPCPKVNLDYVFSISELENTDRGEGGFGSTGV